MTKTRNLRFNARATVINLFRQDTTRSWSGPAIARKLRIGTPGTFSNTLRNMAKEGLIVDTDSDRPHGSRLPHYYRVADTGAAVWGVPPVSDGQPVGAPPPTVFSERLMEKLAGAPLPQRVHSVADGGVLPARVVPARMCVLVDQIDDSTYNAPVPVVITGVDAAMRIHGGVVLVTKTGMRLVISRRDEEAAWLWAQGESPNGELMRRLREAEDEATTLRAEMAEMERKMRASDPTLAQLQQIAGEMAARTKGVMSHG